MRDLDVASYGGEDLPNSRKPGSCARTGEEVSFQLDVGAPSRGQFEIDSHRSERWENFSSDNRRVAFSFLS